MGDDFCRFGEEPLPKSSGESSDGRFPGLDREDEEGGGEVCPGEAGNVTRKGFFFFSNRGRPQPHLGHF